MFIVSNQKEESINIQRVNVHLLLLTLVLLNLDLPFHENTADADQMASSEPTLPT